MRPLLCAALPCCARLQLQVCARDRSHDLLRHRYPRGPAAGRALIIVHWVSPVSSRQIEYYFPDDYVDVLPGGPVRDVTNGIPLVFYHHATLSLPSGTSELIRPATRHIICMLASKGAAALLGWTPCGPLFVSDAGADGGIDFGEYHISSQNK